MSYHCPSQKKSFVSKTNQNLFLKKAGCRHEYKCSFFNTIKNSVNVNVKFLYEVKEWFKL